MLNIGFQSFVILIICPNYMSLQSVEEKNNGRAKNASWFSGSCLYAEMEGLEFWQPLFIHVKVPCLPKKSKQKPLDGKEQRKIGIWGKEQKGIRVYIPFFCLELYEWRSIEESTKTSGSGSDLKQGWD